MIPVNTIHIKAPVPSPSKGLRSCKGLTEPAPRPAPKRPSKMAMPRATATPASMPDHEIPLPTLIPKRFLPYSIRFSSFINTPQLSWEVYLCVVHESCQRHWCLRSRSSFPERSYETRLASSVGEANIFLVHRIAPVNLALTQTAKRDFASVI